MHFSITSCKKKIIDVIGKLNVNDESCTNHFVQYAALEALNGDQGEVLNILKVLRERRDLCVDLLADIEGVFCYRPNATFYLYPEVTVAMANKGFNDYQVFLSAILENTGVSMCARAHFGTPLPGETKQYVRLAYSGIDLDLIQEGLVKLKTYLES